MGLFQRMNRDDDLEPDVDRCVILFSPLFEHRTVVAPLRRRSRRSPQDRQSTTTFRIATASPGITSTGPSPTLAQLSVMFPPLLPDDILLESAVGRVQRIPLQVSGWSGRHPRGQCETRRMRVARLLDQIRHTLRRQWAPSPSFRNSSTQQAQFRCARPRCLA